MEEGKLRGGGGRGAEEEDGCFAGGNEERILGEGAGVVEVKLIVLGVLFWVIDTAG